ncbi:MAG: alpha-N-acetylglucosaminidase [Clostridia bacterium]|nr:alpha-N-acetylglucosaminidase [Clostridia bacterium]
MKNLILRNTPDIACMFELRSIESDNGKNRYEVFCENGKIVICGDCVISQAMGYYAYLKKYCRVNLSHCGNTEINVSEAPLFDGKLSKTIFQDKRAYLTYRSFGYSLAFWTWEKWEKEIDFMAMNGINMPLCLVGSEAVWYYTMRDFKYSETGALSYLSGPSFWPWQMMNRFASYYSLTDPKYIESRVELGKKIIDREVSLGMSPVLPGFAGMVPQSFKKLFEKLRMQIMPSWNNFPFTFRLDFFGNVFKKFGTALLEKQRHLFGAFHYYSCDPYIVNKSELKSKDYLWKVGRAIDTLYKDFDPESKWIMMSDCLYEKMVKSVPKDRLIIFDLDGTLHSQTDEFWGYDYILGMGGGSGDRTVLHGNMTAAAENPYLDAPENCIGTGVFYDGILSNPMYFELMFDMLTENKKTDLGEWCKDYALRRYSSADENYAKAAEILRSTCYDIKGRETGSVICARPCTDLKHTAPFDVIDVQYDNKKLLEAAELLISAEKTDSDGRIYDICDITRQVLSNYAHICYEKAVNGFRNRDQRDFERYSNSFLKICEELDELLQSMSEMSLHTHLKEAGALALTDKDKQNFELNLLTQITLWGPIGDPLNYDYAWKEWGGLIGTYYAKRWQSFFELLAYRFTKRGKFSTATRKQINGRNEYRGNSFYKNYSDFERKWLSTSNPESPTDADTVELAERLIEKYKKVI